MSYPVFIKKGNKTERFTVRILLLETNDIVMTKNKEDFYVIAFTASRKSIIKEYPDGTLIHEKSSYPFKKV